MREVYLLDIGNGECEFELDGDLHDCEFEIKDDAGTPKISTYNHSTKLRQKEILILEHQLEQDFDFNEYNEDKEIAEEHIKNLYYKY